MALSAYIPGTIRDATTGIPLVINADGSINLTMAGTKSTDTSLSIDNAQDSINGTIRDANSGSIMVVNANGSINVATA